MKNLIASLVFLFASISLFAGHERGSLVITYTQVPGQPLQYEVTIRAIFDTYAIAPSSSMNLTISSSCFSNFLRSLPRVGGSGSAQPIGGTGYCTSTFATFYSGLAEYKGIITLPAHCASITLSLSSGPGRFDGTENIQSMFDTPYFYAKLNSTLGANNSPDLPDSDLIQAVCINKSVSLFGFTESDGDSIFFEKTTPLKAATTNFSWKTGYSQSNPLGAGSTYSLNSASGVVQANVGNIGNYIMPIKYREYRLDTNTSSMVMVGEGVFSLFVSGTASCSSPTSISILHESTPSSDSIQCGSNKIRFIGSRQLSRSSLSATGSDIQVVSKKQGNLSISSATLIQDSIVEVTLVQAAPLSDTLSLVAKVGNDGNVIISRCGTELTAYDDTLVYYTPSGSMPIASGSVSNQFLTAQFNAGATVADSVSWDFGDGSFSNSSSGNHSYATAGTYTVTLTAYGVCGTTDISTFTIQVCDTISANFNYSQAGDTVSFHALSFAGISNYYWDFGDGQTATGDSVNHIYATGGTYIAVLTVTNLCGDTATFTMTVETCLPPQASWTYTLVGTTPAGMTIDFDGTASTNAATFMWDFGDGTTDNTTLTPRHVYQTPGLHYYVKLTVDNTCQQSSEKGFRLNQIDIDELAEAPGFEIYPNPVDDIFTVEWSAGNTLKYATLYDMQGRKLHTCPIVEQGQASLQISMSKLASGSYILKMESSNGRTQQTLIQKK